MMMRRIKPETQEEILNFIDNYYAIHHKTPTVREIAAGTTLQKSGVCKHLMRLRDLGLIDYDNKMIYTEKITESFTEYIQVGIVGQIPCGQAVLEEEDIEEYVNLPISIFGQGDLYILHAYGDSMTGAGIDPGDLVVVQKQPYANDGDIVVAYVEGEGSTLKRYMDDPENKRIILHPENEKYPDIVAKDCQIQGVVRKIIKNV